MVSMLEYENGIENIEICTLLTCEQGILEEHRNGNLKKYIAVLPLGDAPLKEVAF